MYRAGWILAAFLMIAVPGRAQDLAQAEPQRAKVEIDNEQVRVVRVKLEPHAKGVMHEHSLPYLVIALTDAQIRHTLPDGKSEDAIRKAGEVRWARPVKHSHENLTDKPAELILVEIKGK